MLCSKKAHTKISNPSKIVLSRTGSKSVQLEWTTVKNAQGYNIYRSTSKKGTYRKIASVKSNKNVYNDKKLTTLKTYYYKIETVAKKNSYNNKSNAKSIKVKYSIGDTFIAINNQTYTGNAIKPNVELFKSVTNFNKVNSKNYSIAYSNNINAGTATVTITGKNDYYGTKKQLSK